MYFLKKGGNSFFEVNSKINELCKNYVTYDFNIKTFQRDLLEIINILIGFNMIIAGNLLDSIPGGMIKRLRDFLQLIGENHDKLLEEEGGVGAAEELKKEIDSLQIF